MFEEHRRTRAISYIHFCTISVLGHFCYVFKTSFFCCILMHCNLNVLMNFVNFYLECLYLRWILYVLGIFYCVLFHQTSCMRSIECMSESMIALGMIFSRKNQSQRVVPVLNLLDCLFLEPICLRNYLFHRLLIS